MTKNTRHLIRGGLTLVELLVVLTILAVMTTLAVTMTDNFVDQGRYEATQRTLDEIQKAILGDTSQSDAAGRRIAMGYIADTGRLPKKLQDLWIDPGIGGSQLVPVLHPKKETPIGTLCVGWRGPYVQLASSNVTELLDGWGNPFNPSALEQGNVYSDGGVSDPYKGPLYMRRPIVPANYLADVHGSIIDTKTDTPPTMANKVTICLYYADGNKVSYITPESPGVGGTPPTLENLFAFTFPKMIIGPKILVAFFEDDTSSEAIPFYLTTDGAMQNIRMDLK